MRALICDWCGTVRTNRDGWYEVQPAGVSKHAAFGESPRTFCGLDCLGDFVDDARTSPTGDVTGASAPPIEVELPVIAEGAALPAEPAVALRSDLPGDEAPAVAATVLELALASPDESPTEAPAEDDAVPAVAEEETVLLRGLGGGLGRGLGRTGS